MKLLTLTLLINLSLSVYADETIDKVADKICSLNFYTKIYRLEKNQALSANDILVKNNCNEAVANKMAQLISSSEGSLSSDFLQREIKKDFSDLKIEITPRKISLLDLNATMREQLLAGTNLYFLNSRSLNGLRTLGMVEGEQISLNCESCNTYGEKNIKIDIINPLTNSMRTVWFNSKIMAKIKVFKAKRSIGFQQKSLSVDDFYSDEIYSMTPDSVLSSLDNIHFYKVNKTLIQGAVVSNLDLQPVNLISFGTPVTVILKSNNINLQRTAMPTRSAQFGESIELRNPSNNKTLAGKVVDYNKVVIEL